MEERRISRIGMGLAVYGGISLFTGLGSIGLAFSPGFLDSFGRTFFVVSVSVLIAFGTFVLLTGTGLRRRREFARKSAAGLCYSIATLSFLLGLNATYLWLRFNAASLGMGLAMLCYIGVIVFLFFRAGRYFGSPSVRALFATAPRSFQLQ